jgi:S-adenosylmethionine/arginine decarboxylase-like enzyme
MSSIITHSEFVDLAPTIVRRRLVIECIHQNNLDADAICQYMIQLSNVMNMTIVAPPTTQFEPAYGISAYMCWKESGMHVYTWTANENRPNFLSIDIYTCKNFDINQVIDFTKSHFQNNITQITWRE